MTLRHVAPAGAPITTADLIRWGRRGIGTNGHAALAEAIATRFGAKHVFLTNTGRAGLTVAFRALRTLAPSRDEVVLPAYTCFSVAASAVRAGLKVRIVDVDPATLDFDREGLETCDLRKALAVVATNPYGYPSDMRTLRALTRHHGVFLIDDAAQAMGASADGSPSGVRGDVGLFSLDKGKNVSAIDGGIVIAQSDEVADAIRQLIESLPPATPSVVAELAAKLCVYVTFLRPSLYWIPNSLPNTGIGATVYRTDFALAQMPAPVASLGRVMLDRLDGFSEHRRMMAESWRRALAGVDGISQVRAVTDSTPACLRYPILEADGVWKDRTIRALNAVGVGASCSYPTQLSAIPNLAPHLVGPCADLAGGRTVAARIVTLPTHPLVTERDVRRGAAALANTRARGAFAVAQNVPSK
jgi:perosamine synthetase